MDFWYGLVWPFATSTARELKPEAWRALIWIDVVIFILLLSYHVV